MELLQNSSHKNMIYNIKNLLTGAFKWIMATVNVNAHTMQLSVEQLAWRNDRNEPELSSYLSCWHCFSPFFVEVADSVVVTQLNFRYQNTSNPSWNCFVSTLVSFSPVWSVCRGFTQHFSGLILSYLFYHTLTSFSACKQSLHTLFYSLLWCSPPLLQPFDLSLLSRANLSFLVSECWAS